MLGSSESWEPQQAPRRWHFTARPSDLNPHIAAVDPIQLMQVFLEHRETGLLICLDCRAHEHADPTHLLALLRTPRKRPCGRNDNYFNEIASSHCLHRGGDYAE